MSKFVLYGTDTDGPYATEVPDTDADQYATAVGGTVHDTLDGALDAWRHRHDDSTPDAAPEAVSDPAAPVGTAPGSEAGSGDPRPEDGAQGASFGTTETPAESSQPVDQR